MSDRRSSVAFEHRDFRLYLAGWSFANLGAEMLAVAVGWQIYAAHHRALDLGYVGLAQFGPAAALSLVAGNVADRVDRAFLFATCNLALTACALALLAVTVSGPHLLPLYAILVLVGVARTFESPASQALVPQLVPGSHLASAISWTSTIWQLATIAGPALGGALYGAVNGAGAVYATSAVAFAIASSAAFMMKPRAPARDRPRASFRDVVAGLRFVLSERVILEALSLDLFAVLFGGATAILPAYASDVLHTGPWGLGVLRSAPAAGAVLTAMALARRPLRRRAGATMLACVASFGASTVVFGLSRSISLSVVALALLGASDMVSVVVRGTVVQLRTPDGMRGRVSAVNNLFISTSSDLGQLESGFTAAWLGVVPAVVLGGFAAIVVALVYAYGLRGLRAVDALDGGVVPA